MINKLENCEINAAIVFEQLTKISFKILLVILLYRNSHQLFISKFNPELFSL